MVPVLMPAPPRNGERSTSATRLPKYAAWTAPFSPAGPEPMTTRSYSGRSLTVPTIAARHAGGKRGRVERTPPSDRPRHRLSLAGALEPLEDGGETGARVARAVEVGGAHPRAQDQPIEHEAAPAADLVERRGAEPMGAHVETVAGQEQEVGAVQAEVANLVAPGAESSAGDAAHRQVAGASEPGGQHGGVGGRHLVHELI